MAKIEYGYRPSVLFKKGIRTKRNGSGAGSIVAIIGAFPCVSPEIQHFTDLDEARNALGIVAGVHDEEFVTDSNGELVKNPNYYYGAGALKQVFLDKTDLAGASEVIICNITTKKIKDDGSPDCDGDGNQKYNVTLKHDQINAGDNQALYKLHEKVNFDKLTVAFSKLKKEKFHNLVFAYPLDDTTGYFAPVIDAGDTDIEALLKRYRNWTRETYTVQHPCIGFFGVTTNPTLTFGDGNEAVTVNPSVIDSLVDSNYSVLIDTESVIKYLDIFKDESQDIHSLGAIFAEGTYDENSGYILNPVEAVAQYAGFVAGTPVDTPLTQKPVPTVKGIGLRKGTTTNNSTTYSDIYEELNYDPDVELNPDGYKLIKKGATMYECTNRATKEYSVVSSTLPCGFDLAHVRTSAYVIEQITLNPFLGKINRDTTLQAIDSVITTIKNSMVERFPIIESIAHTVEKVSPTCVRIRIHINFYGIIINEVVYMSVSVENQNRMVG